MIYAKNSVLCYSLKSLKDIFGKRFFSGELKYIAKMYGFQYTGIRFIQEYIRRVGRNNIKKKKNS